MSKVLVDRELLERVEQWVQEDCTALEELQAVLAQPAEAEGVEVVAFQVRRTAWGTTSNLYTEKLPFVPGEGVTQYSEPTALIRLSDHLAALSAVTAERDRLAAGALEDLRLRTSALELMNAANAERDQLRAEVERWKGHASNWESVAHKQYRKLKDILRSLASDKALSVFPAPCPERELPVPCEVIHDDDVLLVIHQRAAMAAKEA